MPQIQSPPKPSYGQLGYGYQLEEEGQEGEEQYYQRYLPDLNDIYVRYPNGRDDHIHIIRESEASRNSTIMKISECMRRVFRPIMACMAKICPNEDVDQIEGH